MTPSELKAKVEFILSRTKSNPVTGCVEWQGYRGTSGYGQTTLNGKLMACSRAIYMAANGVSLSSEQHVCHKCDNPPCVNLDHLFLGSALENMRDCHAKKRSNNYTKPNAYLRGEKCHRSKLTLAQVHEIKARLSIGDTTVAIGKSFGVTTSAIAKIKHGRAWSKELSNV